MSWPLPPEMSWPVFLRRLRHPSPPKGWLEAAAAVEDIQKRPVLLRWIAQHPKAPAHLRSKLLGRLPWRVLASVAWDAGAHPHARHQASERLQSLWPGMTLGERRSLAALAPKPLWRLVWKVPDAGVLLAFLQHRWLNGETLAGLIQAPLHPLQLEALAASPWRDQEPIAARVLQALDQSLRMGAPKVVLGHGAPWVKSLPPDERVGVANTLRDPALRRMVRVHGIQGIMEEF